MKIASRQTILVVDDESEIANAVQSILEDEGYKVIVATDGAEALSLLAKEKPDLVLMDIMMPKQSGYDVLNTIRQNEKIKDLPVVLMSCVNPLLKQSEFKWQYFLKKPFTIDELMSVVNRFGSIEIKSHKKNTL